MLRMPWVGAWAVAALWLAAGCAADSGRVPVSTAFDPLVRFPAQATWAWDRGKISLPEDPALEGLRLAEAVEQEAEAAFAARGYALDTTGSPDFHLSYHLSVDSFIAADRSSSVVGLSLLLTDANGRRVWTGWGRAPFFVGAESTPRRERLRRALDDMLASFPPRRTASD